ncbi:MAG: hypothetical protein CMN78_01550 [Spirochaetales bacterium]|nr:hypothetical protein [Spirochaetales bacterium]
MRRGRDQDNSVWQSPTLAKKNQKKVQAWKYRQIFNGFLTSISDNIHIMSRIFLLRHGETEGNAERIYRGRWDLPLNSTGKKQAARAGEALKSIKFSSIFVSPLRRARETAAAIIAATGDCELITEQNLIDIDYGAWTKRPAADVAASHPELTAMWARSPHDVGFPEGESLDDVRGRIETLFGDFSKTGVEGNVLFVSHRVPIKVALCHFLGLPNASFWSVAVDTASISVINLRRDRATLVFSNETCHLRSINGKLGVVDF